MSIKNRVFGFSLSIGLALVSAPAARPVYAEPPQDKPAAERDGTDREEGADRENIAKHWVRVRRDKDGNPLAMQTAIVRYSAAEGNDSKAVVDLIGAIHVGDKEYYDELNRAFVDYDALLFELVAPKDAKIEKGRGTSNAHPVGALQNGLKNLLELEHQLDLIDYTKKNFVHADMTPDQFALKMKERNESFLTMFFRMMGQGIAQQNKMEAQGKGSALDLYIALFDKERAVKMKRIMADQFEGMEGLIAGIGGPEGSTIITERNKVALEVMAREMKAGKTKLGIFYGAGHMADMDERLREEHKFAPESVRWVNAWNLRSRGK